MLKQFLQLLLIINEYRTLAAVHAHITPLKLLHDDV